MPMAPLPMFHRRVPVPNFEPIYAAQFEIKYVIKDSSVKSEELHDLLGIVNSYSDFRLLTEMTKSWSLKGEILNLEFHLPGGKLEDMRKELLLLGSIKINLFDKKGETTDVIEMEVAEVPSLHIGGSYDNSSLTEFGCTMKISNFQTKSNAHNSR